MATSLETVGYVTVGGLCFGTIIGRGVVTEGREQGREGLGMLGMAACMFSGAMCGGIGALFVGWWFKSWIKSQGTPNPHATAGNPGMNQADLRRAFRSSNTPVPVKPYTEIGPLVVCAGCAKATSKANGIPPECPHCKHPFAVRLPKPKEAQESKEPRPKARKAEPPPPPPGEEDLVPLRLADATPRRRHSR